MNADSRDESDSKAKMEILEAAVGKLPHEERMMYEAAILAGSQDEVCTVCCEAFLAHKSTKDCKREGCPWSMGNIERMRRYGDLAIKRTDPSQTQMKL